MTSIRLRGVTSSTRRSVRVRDRSAYVALAMAVMNVALYVFTVVAAGLLGPREYGAFASLMAVLIVVAVIQLGIQATAARRISATRYMSPRSSGRYLACRCARRWGWVDCCSCLSP